MCILVPAPWWYLISTNFLQWCRKCTFLVLFGKDIHICILISKFILDKFSDQHEKDRIKSLWCSISTFLMQNRCKISKYRYLQSTHICKILYVLHIVLYYKETSYCILFKAFWDLWKYPTLTLVGTIKNRFLVVGATFFF